MAKSQSGEILITDIVDRITEGKLSDTVKKDHWRVIAYELETVGAGRSVALNDWHAGQLTIRLDATGWHRIHLIYRYAHLRAKLTSDVCFRTCEPVREHDPEGDAKEGWYDAEEVVWRDADLTGQDLILDEAPGDLMAIRLTPITPKADDREVRWPMVITHDDGMMMARPHRSPENLYERFERIPMDSCVRTVVHMGGFADTSLHFSKVGTTFGSTNPDAWDGYARIAVENFKLYQKWGIDPLEKTIEYVRNRGWDLHLYVRHRGWGDVHPVCGAWDSKFNLDHPEFRNVTAEGEPVLGQSIAFPQVRDHYCRYYKELADYGPDGVSPCYVRGCPIVMYEQPMVDGFKQKHGKDPRTLPEDDADWLDYCSEVVTDFMRHIKQAVGPDCKLSPMIHGTKQLNRRFAMDIETWVGEGLVSDLFIMCHQYDTMCDHSQAGPEFLEYDWFEQMPGRARVKLWPMTYMWQMFDADPQLHCDALQGWLDQGADGYGFWDAAAATADQVGNIWDLGKMPRPRYEKNNRLVAKYSVRRYDGYVFDRYTPIEGW